MADYHNLIYFKNADSLYVNLIVPSEVAWQRKNGAIRLRQETSYPEQDTTRLRLPMDRPEQFALCIRVPGWAPKLVIRVNGAETSALAKPGTWARIGQLCKNGDEIVVHIPMELRNIPVDKQHPERVATVYGPVVMVTQTQLVLPKVMSNIVPEKNEADGSLMFRARTDRSTTLIPFYRVPYGTPYAMYTDQPKKT